MAVHRMGIDLGGTKTEIIVLSPDGNEILRERRPTDHASGYPTLLGFLKNFVYDVEQRVGHTCHIGVGMPGSMGAHSGVIRNANTVCLNGKPFLDDLATHLDRNVRITNDANCLALAESVVGAGKNKRVVFGVILGTGVGGGIVIDREVHNGRLGIAGEWGHNPLLQHDDPPTWQRPRQCYCGRVGCVETWLSGPGLSNDYAADGGKSGTSAKQIVDLAKAGDVTAQSTLERFRRRLGRALASVVNTIDPDIIVLGGGLSNIENLDVDARQQMKAHVFSDYVDTPLAVASGGDSAGVLGAAWLWPTASDNS